MKLSHGRLPYFSRIAVTIGLAIAFFAPTLSDAAEIKVLTSRALNSAINAGLADPKVKARLADLGATPLADSPADFRKLIPEETEKWGKVIRAGNIKPG